MSFAEVGGFKSKADKLLGLSDGPDSQIERQKSGYLSVRNELVGVVATWKKRYFVLKDGFILWYTNKSSSPIFDTKPKGCMPLGGSVIRQNASDKRIFEVFQSELGPSANIIVRANDISEAEAWIYSLTQARKATWENAQLGNALVEKMRAAGTALEQEKAIALEQFQAQAQNYKHEAEEKERQLKDKETLHQEHEMQIVTEQERIKELEEEAMLIDEKLNAEEQMRRAAKAKRMSVENKLMEAERALAELEEAFARQQEEEKTSHTSAAAAVTENKKSGSNRKSSRKSNRKSSKEAKDKSTVRTGSVAFDDGEEILANVSLLRKFFEDKQKENAKRKEAMLMKRRL